MTCGGPSRQLVKKRQLRKRAGGRIRFLFFFFRKTHSSIFSEAGGQKPIGAASLFFFWKEEGTRHVLQTSSFWRTPVKCVMRKEEE